MEKNLAITLLLDLYKGVLTKKQAEALDLYYNEDLSLAEIAENAGVTRQAVRDAIIKGEKTLLELEEMTGLSGRIKSLEGKLKKINQLAKNIDNTEMAEIISLSEIGE